MAKKRKKYVMTAAHKAKLIAAAKKRRGVKRGSYKQNKITNSNDADFKTSINREIARLEQQIEKLKGLL